ncbi:MAG: MbnP family protein [Crocinitomicaceae bacterium]
MKRILLCALALISTASFAQTDVALRINHKLGTADFAYDQIAQNNLGQDFKATRLEYYLSQVTIVHDGGMETSVPLDTIALVQPGTEIATTIPLGNYSVTSIESVRFYIGVQEPTNNEDPSLYSVDHPLGPKSPSMHWGWTAGYRFVAYEGFGGSGFSQNFQLHGLGNENYFEVAADVDVVDESGVLVMDLNADYTRGVEDIDLNSGTISHGSTGEAKQTLENWRDFVFGNYYLGIEKDNFSINWSVYPNPSSGLVTIKLDQNINASTVQISNALGEIVEVITLKENASKEVELTQSGIFIFTIQNESGVAIETKRIVIK